EQMNACDAASERGSGNASTWRPDDLGIAEGQTEHLERHDSRVHAGDDKDPRMGYPVETVLIKALGEHLVVCQQIVEGVVSLRYAVRPVFSCVLHAYRPPGAGCFSPPRPIRSPRWADCWGFLTRRAGSQRPAAVRDCHWALRRWAALAPPKRAVQHPHL